MGLESTRPNDIHLGISLKEKVYQVHRKVGRSRTLGHIMSFTRFWELHPGCSVIYEGQAHRGQWLGHPSILGLHHHPMLGQRFTVLGTHTYLLNERMNALYNRSLHCFTIYYSKQNRKHNSFDIFVTSDSCPTNAL